MAQTPMFRTIGEYLQFIYAGGYKEVITSDDVMKADAPLTTSTTGVWNPIYGAQVWSQLNLEANAFGCLPKYQWTRSGWRIETANASYNNLGVAEAGTIADTVMPSWVAVNTKPKTEHLPFENSFVAEALAGKDDTITSFAELQGRMSLQFRNAINSKLLVDNQTAAGYNFESIDRVVASNSEITTCSLAANSCDIYGLDRDAGASVYDAYVDAASSNRVLTEAMLRNVWTTVQQYGGNPQFWLTGWDTLDEIIGLFEDKMRYVPTVKIKPGVNGIESVSGQEAGIVVNTVYGLPIIVSKDTATDSGGISRIYLLDTSDPEGYGMPRLGIKTLMPTMYIETDNPWMHGKFTKKAMYFIMGELICHMFRAQGKIRNLKS